MRKLLLLGCLLLAVTGCTNAPSTSSSPATAATTAPAPAPAPVTPAQAPTPAAPASAATTVAPVVAPAVPAPSDRPLTLATTRPIPGDLALLDRELQASAPVRYRILVVESSGSEDRTDYLDRVMAAWREPGPDTLLLVLFAGDGYDLRFAMGAIFVRSGVKVDEVLALVRNAYFPAVRQGDVAGGLVKLMRAVNGRVGLPERMAP